MKTKILKLIIFSKYLLDIVPAYIKYIKIDKDEISIFTTPKKIENLTIFLLKHTNCKFKQLIDICGVDYPNRKKRFEIIYNLLSLSYNFRVRIKLKVEDNKSIPSISNIYKSGLWLEREV
jgi:NADH:ubiquinone oxidoreductase subunit C